MTASASSPVSTSAFHRLLVATVVVRLLLIGLVLAACTTRVDEKAPVVTTPEPTAARSLTPTIAPRAENDDPPGIAVTSVPYSDTTDVTRAQIHAMEMATCGSGSQSVWYSFTAETEMTLAADTFGSSYDTILDIWEGVLSSDRQNPGFETLVPLACNDNAGDSAQSEVVFAAKAGTSYVIRVSTALNSPGGVLTFHLAEA